MDPIRFNSIPCCWTLIILLCFNKRNDWISQFNIQYLLPLFDKTRTFFLFSFFFSLLEILFLGCSTAVRVYLLYLFDQIVPVNLVALFLGDEQGESVVA